MKHTLILLCVIFFFSCERKPEISFEKTIETAVQAVSEKTDFYFTELINISKNNTEESSKQFQEIKMHLEYNSKLIYAMKEVDAELSIKEKTLTYFDQIKVLMKRSRSFINNPSLDKKEVKDLAKISIMLTKNIKKQLAVFCNKHGFELGLSIYDVEKYESDLKKAKQ